MFEEFACGQAWAILVVLMVGRTDMLRRRHFDLSISRSLWCQRDQEGSLRCVEWVILVKCLESGYQPRNRVFLPSYDSLTTQRTPTYFMDTQLVLSLLFLAANYDHTFS